MNERRIASGQSSRQKRGQPFEGSLAVREPGSGSGAA